MSNEHLPSVFKEILDAVSRPPRHTRITAIESQIIDLRPELDEAQEILLALLCALRNKYEFEDDFPEIESYFKYTDKALGRMADRIAGPGWIEAYDEWLARKDYK